MNEKQIEDDVKKKAKGFSLEDQDDDHLDHEAQSQRPDVQKHILLTISIVVMLILGLLVIQSFSGDMQNASQEKSVVPTVTEEIAYEYVKIATHEVVGDYLTDATNGLTLYTIDEEKCPTQCMTQWIPYAGAQEVNLSSITSEFMETEGQYHYVWNNKKLYYYVPDNLPGDFLGDGFYFVGSIARP